MNNPSPSYLLFYYTSCNAKDIGLPVSESNMLSALIAHCDEQAKGYVASLSLEEIRAKTGMSIRTVLSCQKKLIDKNYIKVLSGRGLGNCNKYVINSRKIVDAYNLSNDPVIISDTALEQYVYDNAVSSEIATRDTTGLRKGKA